MIVVNLYDTNNTLVHTQIMDTDLNLLNKDRMIEEFFGWYTNTYKTYPIALYVNLLQVSDWNYFQPENEMTLIDEVFYKEKYSEYFTRLEFNQALQVMRQFISETIARSNTRSLAHSQS